MHLQYTCVLRQSSNTVYIQCHLLIIKYFFLFNQKTLLSVAHVQTIGNVLEVNLQVYVKIKDANVSQDTD